MNFAFSPLPGNLGRLSLCCCLFIRSVIQYKKIVFTWKNFLGKLFLFMKSIAAVEYKGLMAYDGVRAQ